MTDVRWGIVGPGRIADKVAGDFVHVPHAKLVAVASRSLERAEAFAKQHGIPRAHGSYQAILADPDVDVLYVATPHPQHHAFAKAALKAHKALLIEKAFAATVAGAQELIDLARASRTFVMEAMWTRFQPAVVKVRELIASGAIGELRGLQADLGIVAPTDPEGRFYNLQLGGGAMLDLGVYLISLSQMLFGTHSELSVQGSRSQSGVDVESALILGYPGGVRATLTTSLVTPLPAQARVFGSEGFIDILPRFHHPKDLVVHRKGKPPEPMTLPALGGGYAHELIEVTECLRAGKTESAVMPLADTLAVQRVMNEACERLGVVHAEAP
ncbi:MAG: Gfo/Idh/MocA family oxidoreductase [Deltaproteobacteria bacterium]|nr:Gfo/Idh/MocA family oxidoreductase [Deltaproteobacteria bacterium]